MMKPEVRKRRQNLAATAFVILFGAALAWNIIGVDERRVPEPSITALRTTDLIVDHYITLGSGLAVMTTYPGDPNAHIGAAKGSFVLDTSTPGVWQNTTGSNVWVAAGGSGGGGGGSGFTIAGNGLVGSGSTVSMSGSGCSVGWVPTWSGSGSGFICAAQTGSGGGGGGGSASVTVTVNSFPGSTTNLSTVGTVDWFWWGATGTPASVPGFATANGTNLHWKKGGLLWQSVQWLGGGSFTGPGVFPGTTTFTSTQSDDSYIVALSATDGSYAQCVGGTHGFGFQVNIPASTTSRTLRLYIGAKGVVTTIAASLDDGAGTGSSATYNAASGVNEMRAVDVVFQAALSARLRVTVTETTQNGGVMAEELWGMAEF